MGVIECSSDGSDDLDRLIGWHASWITVMHQASSISSVDVLHSNPQLPVELAPVVYGDDVRVRKRCGDVRLRG